MIIKLVQSWWYNEIMEYYDISLFDGRRFRVDAQEVEDLSCRGYRNWSTDTRTMAVDHFIESNRDLIFSDHFSG